MKIFILCGGFGTRLDHEGKLKAKPMVKIGNKPILIHIIENFVSQGFNEFVFCLGHKSETIINYFLKEKKKNCKIAKKSKKHIKFNYKTNSLKFEGDLIFTGIETGTGGRILDSYNVLNMKSDFIMTYGDGLSNVNIKKLVTFHYKNKSQVTLTAVRPKQRYGVLKIQKNKVKFFDNSKKKSDIYINGGFFVISKEGIKKIRNKNIYWEKEPLSFFLKRKKLYAFKHEGFWKSLDTLKDKNDFNEMIRKNKMPWKNIRN
tara:strand:- start:30 stop:806 length:777 start_codon:yes stop_codon:yes gene_type:complete